MGIEPRTNELLAESLTDSAIWAGQVLVAFDNCVKMLSNVTEQFAPEQASKCQTTWTTSLES